MTVGNYKNSINTSTPTSYLGFFTLIQFNFKWENFLTMEACLLLVAH